jgi:hypothetical protein
VRRLLAPAALSALCGCAAQVRYAPAGAPAQVLHAAKLPLLSLDDVAAPAAPGEIYSHHVGGKINAAIGASGNPVDPEVNWPEVLHDALALELKRLGWPAEPAHTPRAARLKATLVKARADYHAGIGVRAEGVLLIELVLMDGDGREVWQGQLEGAGGGSIGAAGAPENGIRESWSAALDAAMRKLGPLLATDRPWEFLSKEMPAKDVKVPPAADAGTWWSKP